MNILLIGERYSNNLGDGVIYDTVENILNSFKIKDMKIIGLDISGKSKYIINNQVNLKKKKIQLKYIHSKLSSLKRTIFTLKKLNEINLSEIDLVIYAGGQLFSDYFAKQIYYINKTISKRNIPILFNSCGIGIYKKNKSFLKKALKMKNVIGISVRDNFKQIKNDFKINNCYEAMDPVYEISDFFKTQCKMNNIIGIGLMEPNSYLHNCISMDRDEYFNLIKNIVDNLESNNIQWEFFCNGNDDDYRFINEVCRKLNYSIDNISKRPETPNELINTIIKYDKIISFRLHSHIIASSFNIPTLGFEWDLKVKEYFEKLNNSKYCIKLNDFDINDINNKLMDFLEIDSKNFKYQKNKKILLSSKFLENIIGEKNE